MWWTFLGRRFTHATRKPHRTDNKRVWVETLSRRILFVRARELTFEPRGGGGGGGGSNDGGAGGGGGVYIMAVNFRRPC